MAEPYQIIYDYEDVPVIKKFALSSKRIRGLMGPFGSGKSSGCVMEIIRRAHEQAPSADGIRRSRWAVIRASYPQLKDTTIRTVMDWLPVSIFGEYSVTNHNYVITKFPGVHLELMFRALDRPEQVANLLSLELTGAWVNEAREVQWSIIEALDGRIGRYPGKKDGGCTWSGMILDTNPPDENSEWYKFFEVKRPSTAAIFKQPSGLSPQAENLKNLIKGYYTNLAIGKSDQYVRVYIEGKYGYTQEGKAVIEQYNDNTHVALSVIQPMEDRPLICGMDFGLCYDDQTEVLTESGWKLFKDVSGIDRMATKDFGTNVIEYQKPSRKISIDYSGDMYLYENQNLNFCVTPDHVIPCRKRTGRKELWTGDYRLTADYLFNNPEKHYALDLLAEWKGCSLGKFGPLKWSASVFAEFMGIYLSEGNFDKKQNRITIAQKKRDGYFQRILNDTELLWIRGDQSWRVTNKELNNYLKQFGYSHDKYVPLEIKKMGKAEILKFIYSYTRGDGHIRTNLNGSLEHTVFTVSKTMADDFQELAMKVGWYAKIRIVKPQDSIIFENGKARTIHNEGGYCITFKKKAKRSEIKGKNFSKTRYNGKVYCLTVPNGTLYVRRKLTPSWNGNCPALVLAQMTPRGKLLIIDEFISEGMGLKNFMENLVMPRLRAEYFGIPIQGGYGDPAGTSRSPTDESTCYEVLRGLGLKNIVPCPTNALLPRIAAVESLLTKMIDGEPAMIISPKCVMIRKGLNGGYHRQRIPGTTNEFSDQPFKNIYSHILDGLQYLCFYVGDSKSKNKRNDDFLKRIGQQKKHRPASSIAGM
ncbi:MAG: hypothetical protein WC440_02700 [Candidatus Omnitrophota bacterium]